MSENCVALIRKATLLMLLTVPFFSFIQSTVTSPPSTPPGRFNLSHFIFPRVTAALTESNDTPKPPHILQGVLTAIASKEKWALEDVKVSQLDLKKARYGSAQVKNFRVRVRKSEIMLKMYEEALEWKKLSINGSSDFETLVNAVGEKSLIDNFKIDGPSELWVVGDSDRFSLLLPLNVTRSGLRRISVGKGITVEVRGAEEVSIIHPLSNHQTQQRIFNFGNLDKLGSRGFGTCKALMPIRITGSASVVAYRTHRPSSLIRTVSFSRDSMQLMPEKCYVGGPKYNNKADLISSLNLGVSVLGRLLSRFLDRNFTTTSAFRSLKEIISASTVFRFHLELERYVRENDTYWSKMGSWRTRPIVERVCFEVTAITEGDILKPLSIKKVRPFIDVDSFAWSSLLSNLSFSKFPSLLVYPEALTLDVEW